jgi:uncharacterized iron-regulated protein
MKTKLLILFLTLFVYVNQPEAFPNWERRGFVLAGVNASLTDESLISYINQNKQNPADYLIGKLSGNDIILLGERHNHDHQLEMVKSFIQRLSKEFPLTILALEISTDEQDRLDYFLETSTGLEKIKFPSHLSNPLYKDLLIMARESCIKVMAIDMPPRLFKNAQMTRDEYMADRLVAEVEKANKIIALVGCLHAIKAPIEWLTADNSHKYLGLLLNKKNPKLRVSSIYQETNRPDSDIYKSFDKFEECVACNIGEPFSPYEGSSLRLLNCKPVNIPQAFDGIIYYP